MIGIYCLWLSVHAERGTEHDRRFEALRSVWVCLLKFKGTRSVSDIDVEILYRFPAKLRQHQCWKFESSKRRWTLLIFSSQSLSSKHQLSVGSFPHTLQSAQSIQHYAVFNTRRSPNTVRGKFHRPTWRYSAKCLVSVSSFLSYFCYQSVNSCHTGR